MHDLPPIPIQSQGRSLVFLIGAFVAAVIVGAILGAGGRAAGVPEKVTYAFPLLLVLTVLAFITWYSVGPQGRVIVDAQTLVVESRLRATRSWDRTSPPPELRAWQIRTEGILHTNGPVLDFSGPSGRFTVGAIEPSLAASLPRPERPSLLAPDFIVASDDFVALTRELGFDLPGELPGGR